MSEALPSFCTAVRSTHHAIHKPLILDLFSSDLLKDESSEIDLVGLTLPALKSLLDLPTAPGSNVNEGYDRLVHALYRGRSGAKKIKNNLLAGVLVLIVIPSTVKLSRSAVEHCCFLISQKLLDVDGTSLTAAHCAKTLVASASAGNPTLRQCVRLLIPALVEFIAKMAPQAHEGSITEPQAAAIIGETCKAFSISSTLSPKIYVRVSWVSYYPPARQQWCEHTSTKRVDIYTGYDPATSVKLVTLAH
ncbi:uncharacterized protein LACBIDRAFT_313493 [Laccaria bicolor S238N-H82]|uniref:Predicted protein n=1 Tax=Laccaria bicolor (strain S238N-H82 / ATCC MYA-4686) TaxID=486041 RepID=B0D049_LACBS|nr:uncharacterized protein LACBIDRAFT_313493 [Laccaria bicolor S238N-H82]EDR11766.1 predicted protein [Laccaria bicolor S238N-H82]|eukprot:XP_001877663.1 predicted protein [Laccaria bicolor S238N-H82]